MKQCYSNSKATNWYNSLTNDLSSLPFSFVYDKKEYKGFSSEYFTLKDKSVECSDKKETQTITFLFNNSIDVKLILTHYFTHGVTEWTVWFENNSAVNSGIIEDPKVELTFEGKYPSLKGIWGDHYNQYSPYCIDLQNNLAEFSSDAGRATHINFPYFNLEYGDEGVMLAIGWSGTWKASFLADESTTTYTASAVNGLKTYLKPDEKIRTALFVIAPYAVRNENYSTNFWRSWYVEHNLPKADATGAELKPFITAFLAYDTGFPNSDGSIAERHTTWKPSLEKLINEGIKPDFRWFDAGWYIAPDGTSPRPFVKGHDWRETVGTWELDPKKWPNNTFRESTDFARENGIKTLVWFEPERVTDPKNLEKNYGYNPEWAISVPGISADWALLNNIGDPECLKWTTERVCKMLVENKVEMFREDYNFDATAFWRLMDKADGENRSGISECKSVAAHYKLWDDVIACTLSFGGCGFVDSCASGGGRNDLESMRRGVPILRSDSDRKSTSLRLSMTSSFNKWIPFCGSEATMEKQRERDIVGRRDMFVMRAAYLPIENYSGPFVFDDDDTFGTLRQGYDEWHRIAPYLLKDFYTLTPWHKERDTNNFTSFCYLDPETDEGALLAFRQETCLRDTVTIKLPFADSNNKYMLTDEDTKESFVTDGTFTLSFDKPRSARLLWVKKV